MSLKSFMKLFNVEQNFLPPSFTFIINLFHLNGLYNPLTGKERYPDSSNTGVGIQDINRVRTK